MGNHVGAPKYIKKLIINMEELINSNTIIIGFINTPLFDFMVDPCIF